MDFNNRGLSEPTKGGHCYSCHFLLSNMNSPGVVFLNNSTSNPNTWVSKLCCPIIMEAHFRNIDEKVAHPYSCVWLRYVLGYNQLQLGPVVV